MVHVLLISALTHNIYFIKGKTVRLLSPIFCYSFIPLNVSEEYLKMAFHTYIIIIVFTLSQPTSQPSSSCTSIFHEISQQHRNKHTKQTQIIYFISINFKLCVRLFEVTDSLVEYYLFVVVYAYFHLGRTQCQIYEYLYMDDIEAIV